MTSRAFFLALLVVAAPAQGAIVVTATPESRAPAGGTARALVHYPYDDAGGTTSLRFETARVENENKYPIGGRTTFAKWPRRQPQRDRDLGQTFVAERSGQLDAIHLRIGHSDRAVLPAAQGARVAMQLFEVSGTPRVDDHGSPGFRGRYSRTDAPEPDDFLVGETYRPLRIATGRLPKKMSGGDHLRFDFTGEDEIRLEAGKGYGFLLMFVEPAASRGMALANNYYGRYQPDPKNAFVGHGLRREGNPALPRARAERLAGVPGTLGFPDVCTFRDLHFVVEVHATPKEISSLLAGAIDLHAHAGPDVQPRAVDDFELARRARTAGMRAVVLKSHVEPTASRAELVRRVVPGVDLFGGIALNRSVGGLNPEAITAMVRTEGDRGRVVWLPTIDAESAVRRSGEARPFVRVVEGGKPVAALEAVLKSIAQHNLLLATGHATPDEAIVIIDAARAAGVTKVLVTHALSASVGASIDQLKAMAARGAVLEDAYLSVVDEAIKSIDLARHAHVIRVVGPEHFVLSSDLGRVGLPPPADGLRAFVEGLRAHGLTDAELSRMIRDTPARLLGLRAPTPDNR